MINRGQLNTILIRIVAVYGLATGFWFFLTDLFEFTVISDLAIMKQVSAIKALLYVAVSSSLLYLMLQHVFDRIFRSASQLRESELRYSTLIENARDGIFIQTRGQFAYLNASACAMFGAQSPDELMGNMVMGRFHEDYRDKVLERIRIINTERRPVSTTDEKCLRMDGSTFDVDLQAVPFDYKGEKGALVFFRDISERKQAEQELRDREERYRAMIEAFDGFVYICGEDYRIEFMNERLKKYVGYDGTGMHCYKVLHQLDSVCSWCVNAQVFSGKNVRWEVKSPRDKRWYDVSNTPIYNVDGTMSKQAMITDINEHKQLEEQLRHSQKLDSIGTLAGGVAHDFNNILTVIMGACTLLMMKTKSDPELEPFVKQIFDSSERAAKLTYSLLAFSRKQNIRLHPVLLSEVVLTVKELLERIIGEDVQLITDLGPVPLTISVDRGQIEQVLMNLAANARDAMPNGGVLTIKTSLFKYNEKLIEFEDCDYGTYALIEVTDTGSGMEKTTQNKIFEPFFTTKENGRGTGLGLSMAYGIIKQHEGIIRVDSKPGHGTTFSIFLPIGQSNPDAHATLEEQSFPVGNEHILLVEDDDNVREINSNILANVGYKVMSASNGPKALELFEQHHKEISLVILDVIMPGMNGKELHDRLKSINPAMKILFASGYSSDLLQKKGVMPEEVNFLPKPFTIHVFLGKVRELIDLSPITY